MNNISNILKNVYVRSYIITPIVAPYLAVRIALNLYNCMESEKNKKFTAAQIDEKSTYIAWRVAFLVYGLTLSSLVLCLAMNRPLDEIDRGLNPPRIGPAGPTLIPESVK